jgi:hypothetical protein
MWFSCWLSVFLFASCGDDPQPKDGDGVKKLQARYQKRAAEYRFSLKDAPDTPFVFVPAPVMRWTADGNSGSVWVWTKEGRPEVIGCVGAIVTDTPDTMLEFHEFHSLALQPLSRVRISDVRVWAPQGAGIELTRLEDAEVPAATDKLRLVQMRNLAREFLPEMKSDDQLHQLRLSPTPLYRYAASGGEVLDGAIFSYLWDAGTDPELLLLVEARRTDPKVADATSYRWHFAPIRFTWRELWLKRKGKELWHVDQADEVYRSEVLVEPYVTVPVEGFQVN